MLKRSLKFFLFALMLVAAVMMFGCGDDGNDGAAGEAGPSAYEIAVANGFTGTEAEWLDSLSATAADDPSAAEPETCAICHANVDQEEHQGIYNMYTDASTLAATIDSVVSVANGDGTFTTTLTFSVTENTLPYTGGPETLDQARFFAATYDNATGTFPAAITIQENLTALGGGQFTIQDTDSSFDAQNLADGQWYGYVAKDPLEVEVFDAGHIDLFDDVANVGTAVGAGNAANYASPANVAGCQKCHGTPYMKHGYRAPEVNGLGDFASCKSCHFDTRVGGHIDWQVLVSDPERFAEEFLGGPAYTDAEKAQYAYTANIMNDVHMSHSMEFGYPQSIQNCATCHDGKLNIIQADANFTATTCKSCHPVTSTVAEHENRINSHAAPSIHEMWEDAQVLGLHTGVPIEQLDCTLCHFTGNGLGAKLFSQLMPGYNPEIYTAANDGTKYSDIFTATIDNVVFDSDNNLLTIQFSSQETAGQTTGLSKNNIAPTLLVGLYGYGTKDFLVGPHRRDVDTDGDGDFDSDDGRNLEAPIELPDPGHPRITTTSAPGDGTWEATADLSAWADLIADGKVVRAEIAVRPVLKDANDDTVALNAPSRTFDLRTNAFDDIFFQDIVDVKGDLEFSPGVPDVTGSCNNCHDALATTFHSGDRGGNIRVCRLCHDSLDDGSHLEMQSRAIESYVHAIHTFQAFDIGRQSEYDFTNPVDEAAYEVHIEHFFPRFTKKACEACHVQKVPTEKAKYAVSDQQKSLAGRLSKSASVDALGVPDNPTLDRNIGFVPSYVTGPAYRACGGCHRAIFINEDNAGDLVALNAHAKQNGYLFEVQDRPPVDPEDDFGFPSAEDVLEAVIDAIQVFF